MDTFANCVTSQEPVFTHSPHNQVQCVRFEKNGKTKANHFCISNLLRQFFPEKNPQKSPSVLTPDGDLLQKQAIKSAKMPSELQSASYYF